MGSARRVVWAGVIVTVLMVLGVRGGPALSASHDSAQRTFVSLVPACGCAAHTTLDEFSDVSGRRLRQLTTVPFSNGQQAGVPAVQSDGRLLLTFVSGFRCALTGNYAECPKIAPDSCVNRVLALKPGGRTFRVAFTVSGRVAIGDAVPSPDGRRTAFSETPCTTVQGTAGLFIRDAGSGQTRMLFGRRNACDGFGRPAWNASGSLLVVTYFRATRAPLAGPAGGVRSCPIGRSRLLIVGPTGSRSIAPDRGCVFAAAAFDPQGGLAVEGCRHSDQPDLPSTVDDLARLVQLTHTGRPVSRWTLKRGLEQALVAAEPGTDRVLVTQDLPANNHELEADWVWEYNGRVLRPVAHYRALDAAQVLAVPWR
ncbi:MAG: hypothetical protein ACR2NR_02730 [Solirubrobacteraceae bacterium]